jgi:hypothetical protein
VAKGKGGKTTTVYRKTPAPAHDPTIALTAGTAKAIPTCTVGSVRIRLVQVSRTAAGDIDLLLEVAGEARLMNLGLASTPSISKAIDDQGLKLAAGVQPTLHEAGPAAADLANGRNLIVINGNVVTNGAAAMPPPQQVTARLSPGNPPAGKEIKELSGKLSLQTVVDCEALVVVDKVLDAAGKTVKGKDGNSLTVRTTKVMKNGDVRLDVSVDSPSGMNGLGGNRIVIQGGGNVVINGGGNIAINGGGGMGPPVDPAKLPRLLDASGKAFNVVESAMQGTTIANGQMSIDFTVTYRPAVDQGPAAQLLLPGQRVFSFDVPFTLKDIKLP